MGYSILGIDLPDGCASALGCFSFVLILGAVGACTCSSWMHGKLFGEPVESAHPTEQVQPTIQEQDAGVPLVLPTFQPSTPGPDSQSSPRRNAREHRSRRHH